MVGRPSAARPLPATPPKSSSIAKRVGRIHRGRMPKPPNLLFFFPDQHRHDWTGANAELPLSTPCLDALAARGVRFTQCYTPSPICAPARACLATGRDYHRCGVRTNQDNTPLDRPTYFRHLREVGYQVCGVGKYDIHKGDGDWGIDGAMLLDEYGFTCGIDNEGKGAAIASYLKNGNQPKGPYMKFLADRGLTQTHVDMYLPTWEIPEKRLNFEAITELPEDAYCDNWVADNALHFLEQFDRERPWHLWINFVGPHDPYDVTPAMRERWGSVDFPPPVDNANPADAVVRRQNYAAMIENIDRHVGRIIDAVADRGELDNTVIVYCSDHGEMLGDHDRWAKSVWYEPSVHVPLIVAGPGAAESAVSAALVSMHDLSATFLDYAGAAPLPAADARSLRPSIETPAAPHRDCIFSSLEQHEGLWDMVFDGRYKYTAGGQAGECLYDLASDPDELHNLSAEHPEKARLAGMLEEHLASATPKPS